MCTVQSCSINGNAELGSLHNRVLFRVYRIAFFHLCTAWDSQFVPQAFTFVAAGLDPCRRSVISCGHNPLVFDDHTAYLTSGTETA